MTGNDTSAGELLVPEGITR